MPEYVTRDEYLENIRRLDEADAELMRNILSTERELRSDYEDKIAKAVHEVGKDVVESRTALKENITLQTTAISKALNAVQDHLTWQDRTVGVSIATLIMYVVLHYAFGVG